MDRLSDLELAALMCSRVCHDIISPVGAIVNGLEVLEDDDDPDMRAHAMDLITKSATQASNKLQFARLAFGAAGSAGAELDLADAERVAGAFLADGRTELVWSGPAATMGKDWVKLLLNLILLAMNAIPRGGQLAVTVAVGERPRLQVTASGQGSRRPDEALGFLQGTAEAGIDARSVQPYFTRQVAEFVGAEIAASMDGEQFVVTAEARGSGIGQA